MVTKHFSELTTQELYDVLQFRASVFVVEQMCPYLDPDGVDNRCLHLWKREADKICAYVRIIPPNELRNCMIGRVAVSKNARGKQWGREIMEEAVRQCRNHYPGYTIDLHAQYQLQNFYSHLGFEPYGQPYLEDGMPHVSMRLKW